MLTRGSAQPARPPGLKPASSRPGWPRPLTPVSPAEPSPLEAAILAWLERGGDHPPLKGAASRPERPAS